MKCLNGLSFFLVFLLVGGQLAHAGEPEINASLDKNSVRVNEEIHLNIKITGVRDSLQAPHLPSLEGFEIFYSGRSSRFSFINGKSESLTEFNYVLVPRSVGRFVMQPIEISVDNKTYRTNQLEINVEADQTVQRSVPQPSPQNQQRAPAPIMPRVPWTSQPSQTATQSQSAATAVPADVSDENIFLKATPSLTTVYTNQQLVLSYSLYTRYDTRYEGFIEEPETSGFWIEEFPMDQNIGRDTEVIGGKKYVRADVKKLALFPTSPGQYEVKPGIVKTSVQIQESGSSMFDEFFNDSFFNGSGMFAKRVEKRLSPPPIKIVVKPLPEEGKPSNFNGAVGEFRMATSVDKRVVNQNEAVTLEISLEGEGNIETLTRPAIPEMKDVKTYEADTRTQLFRQSNLIAGRKSFEVVIIPGEAGDLTIPSIEFSFFNPKTERYVMLKSESYKIKVNPSTTLSPALPASSSGLFREDKKSIRLEATDIQYIKEDKNVRGWIDAGVLVPWLFAVDGLLSLGCVFAVWKRRRDQFLEENIGFRRSLYAKKYAGRGLRRLDQLAKSKAKGEKSDALFFDESARILNQYLSDKLNVSAHGLTHAVIENRLIRQETDREVIQKIRECYETCDLVRFGRMNSEDIDRALIIQRIREIIYALEKKT